MAAAACKLFHVFVLLSILGKGMCLGCSLSDILVTQSSTGKTVKGKAEYSVEVSNTCSCPQIEVRLKCDGYATVEIPDPTVFRPDGSTCIVNGNGPVVFGLGIKFNYAWDTPTAFEPASAIPTCG